MSRRLSALLALTALLTLPGLSACSLAPKDVRPDLPVPPSWPIGDPYLAQSEAALPSVTWQQVFLDPRLQKIIEQALANNRDLRVAVANIAAARAQYRIQRANLFPEVDGSARYTHSGGGNGTSTIASSGSTSGTGTGGTQTGGTGTGGIGTGTGAGGSGSTGTGSTGGGTGTGTSTSGSTSTSSVTSTASNAFLLDVGATAFEVDLFGRVRSLTRQQQDLYFAQQAAARATRLSLIGNIAIQWLTYASDASLLKVAQQTAAVAQSSVRLTQARLKGGIAPRTDLTQAQTILATAEADLAQQRTLLAQDANTLQLLVGAPVDLSLLSTDIEQAAGTIAPLPAGLDSTILLRRPDVVQAEYQLRAANAQIGAARAALLPRISLTGLAGIASSALSSLFTGGAFSYSIAGNASYPIFRAGAGIAGVRYSQAERDAALATYERSIQTAFQETSDALAREGTLTDQLRANRQGFAAAQDTLNLVNAQYRGGITTFLSSLDAQRTLYGAQQTLIATLLVGGTNRATLYRVLGGDATLDAAPNGPRPVTPTGRPREEEPLPSANPGPRPTPAAR
jgi:multidrug efflux system outer membrane protein